MAKCSELDFLRRNDGFHENINTMQLRFWGQNSTKQFSHFYHLSLAKQHASIQIYFPHVFRAWIDFLSINTVRLKSMCSRQTSLRRPILLRHTTVPNPFKRKYDVMWSIVFTLHQKLLEIHIIYPLHSMFGLFGWMVQVY